MSEMSMKSSYLVHSYETDANGKLSVSSLFNYLQDIAGRHAESLHFGKEDLEKENCFWVLSRILVEMDTMPSWGDSINITTWPRGVEGVFALRDFKVSDSSGKIIGKATSSWLVVDMDGRRPKRPNLFVDSVKDRLISESATGRSASKLEGSDHFEYDTPVFSVKYSDLDINMHVNNVKYIQWALDAYPLDFRLNNELASAEVNYLSESLPGDELTVKISQVSDDVFLHSVVREIDNRELCRVRVKWRKTRGHNKTDNVY